MQIAKIIFAEGLDSSPEALLHRLQSALLEGTFLAGRDTANEDHGCEAEGPFASFEIQELLSQDFAIEIKLKACAGEVSAVVSTIRFNDSYGQGSQDYCVFRFNGFEASDEVNAFTDEKVLEFAERVRKVATEHMTNLLEAVGVSRPQALQLSCDHWA